jgi:hypothetical protein
MKSKVIDEIFEEMIEEMKNKRKDVMIKEEDHVFAIIVEN